MDTPIKQKYKQEDLVALRKGLDILIKALLEELLKHPIYMRTLSSTIQHTDLEPEGDVFDIHIRMEVHPKKEPEK